MTKNKNYNPKMSFGQKLEDWPPESLEPVIACPVCNCKSRKMLHNNLADKVFHVAPGHWTLYRCQDCRSAYLDPRPSAESIHLAYSTYWTHIAPETSTKTKTISIFENLNHFLTNSYCNWRYGANLAPANILCVPFVFLLATYRRRLDLRFRYLPRHAQGSRLLDVGFGNGEFLENAKAIGWNVAGVDPDAKVVENAKDRGLNVRKGGIEAFSDQPESFDAITLNHVIEHVHEPTSLLQTSFKLLKSGGMLYVDTPNINSYGYLFFGQNWRGLEPPRHLVVFCRDSLKRALKDARFNKVRFLRRPEMGKGIFRTSQRLLHNKDPYSDFSPNPSWKSHYFIFKSFLRPSKLEFITLVATKK